MTSCVAFHNDPALKADVLDRLDRCLNSGRIKFGDTCWDGKQGSPLGVSIESTDTASYGCAFGYPMALAALLDPLAAQLSPSSYAKQFVRDWIDRVVPGADLSSVPTRIVLDLLVVPEVAGIERDIVESLLYLHRHELTGVKIDRREWRAVQAAILVAMEAEGSPRRAMLLGLCEGLAWSARNSRSILTDGVRLWLRFAELDGEAEWSAEDRLSADALLEALWAEHAPEREAGLPVSYPKLFAERNADLAERFETNLRRVNAGVVARRRSVADTILRHLEMAA